MEELRDIKGLMEIEEYSLYIFFLIIAFALLILFFIIKKIINYKRVISPIKKAKKELENIDLSQSKVASYKICKYGKVLSDEDFEYLEKYKYKKEVEEFSDEDKKKIKRFLDAI